MGDQQYLRKAGLLVGNTDGDVIDLSQLRFTFQVKRGDIQTPNSAQIRVYNINPKITGNKIMQATPEPEFTRVVLQAGYKSNYGIIFDGEIIQVRMGRESPTDTYMDLTVADGDKAYNYSFTAQSLAANQTDPKSQVETIIKNMATKGVTQGKVPTLNQQKLYRGKVLFGQSRELMRDLAANNSCSWSIQDGKVVMIPLTSYLEDEAVEINAATGMIGLPEQTQNGIVVKTLLNPKIRIGQTIKLNNDSIQKYGYGLSTSQQIQNANIQNASKFNGKDGLYYVMNVEHSGDTRGNPWYSDLVCLSVDPSVKPNDAGTFPLNNIAGLKTTIKRFG